MIRNFPKWQAWQLLQKALPSKNLIYFKDRSEWRKWLEENHNSSDGVWLIYYKKHTGKQRIPYDDAVEEALCFGWIDSTVKKIDEEKFSQKFTPRRDKSIWSDLNKKRVKKLIGNGLMTEHGLNKIKKAKDTGDWERGYPERIIHQDCPELRAALEKDLRAKMNFKSFPPSQKKLFITWIASAKRDETKKRRLTEALDLLRRGGKLGMK